MTAPPTEEEVEAIRRRARGEPLCENCDTYTHTGRHSPDVCPRGWGIASGGAKDDVRTLLAALSAATARAEEAERQRDNLRAVGQEALTHAEAAAARAERDIARLEGELATVRAAVGEMRERCAEALDKARADIERVRDERNARGDRRGNERLNGQIDACIAGAAAIRALPAGGEG